MTQLFVLALAILVTACASPRTADNMTLARIAKDYIGVASVDEIEITNLQKMPVEGANHMGLTHYRYFVNTARGKKFICDVQLWGTALDGKPYKPDAVACEPR